MSWDYNYEAGPPGGSLFLLSLYTYDVRITSEPTLGYRGRNPILAYRHGEESSPRKFHPAANVLLETWLRYTNAGGSVTHTDGKPGHVYENYGKMKALLTGAQASLIRLQRTAPEQGTVYMDVELVAEGRPTQAQHIIGWPLRAPHPFWIGAASAQQSPTTITNGGTAPVMDAIVAVTGTANTPRLTHSATGDYIEIAGALPAGGITIDVGAQTCTRISGGADWSSNLAVNAPGIWMEFDPGANTVAATESSGSPSWTVDFALQYR
jgi:hypothetical protein